MEVQSKAFFKATNFLNLIFPKVRLEIVKSVNFMVYIKKLGRMP